MAHNPGQHQCGWMKQSLTWYLHQISFMSHDTANGSYSHPICEILQLCVSNHTDGKTRNSALYLGVVMLLTHTHTNLMTVKEVITKKLNMVVYEMANPTNKHKGSTRND